MSLNDKQKAFCREYIIDLNATQAAIRAGYSKKAATPTASRLLMKVNIQAEIKRLIDARNQRTDITADRVIEQLARIAFMDIKTMIEWGTEERKELLDYTEDDDGKRVPVYQTDYFDFVRLKDPESIDGTLIQTVKMGKHGMVVEFPDRMKALEALAKHTGVYDDRPNVTVDMTGFVTALKETAAKVGGLWDEDPDNDPGGDPNGQS